MKSKSRVRKQAAKFLARQIGTHILEIIPITAPVFKTLRLSGQKWTATIFCSTYTFTTGRVISDDLQV